MKMKYDESDNALIRASRAVTDKMTDLIGERLLRQTQIYPVVTRNDLLWDLLNISCLAGPDCFPVLFDHVETSSVSP